jgi:hypothetical protein
MRGSKHDFRSKKVPVSRKKTATNIITSFVPTKRRTATCSDFKSCLLLLAGYNIHFSSSRYVYFAQVEVFWVVKPPQGSGMDL